MGELIKMAWRNMWRNWRRTAIALVAIVLGLILLLFADGLIKGTDQAMFGNAIRLYGGNIMVHSPGYRDRAHRLPLLPLVDPDVVVQASLGQPETIAAAKRINTGGLITSREGTFPVKITATEPAMDQSVSGQAQSITAGRYLMPEDGDAVLIGQGLADLLKVNVGDRVTLLGKSQHETMRQRTMTVVGIYDMGMAEAEKGVVFITLPEAQSLYNLRNQVTEVAITLQYVGLEEKVAPSLEASLPGYDVDSWETLKPDMRELMDTKAAFTEVIGFAVLGIAAVGILNLMLMAIIERTREMGVLAALGMKGRHVMTLFVLEGAMIGAVGAVVGGILGVALVWGVSQVGVPYAASDMSGMGEMVALMGGSDRLYPSVDVMMAVNRGIAVIIIAALASIYPAWMASRKEPAEVLRHT